MIDLFNYAIYNYLEFEIKEDDNNESEKKCCA